MKHFFSLLLFIFIGTNVIGNTITSVPTDTIVLANDLPSLVFDLVYIDKFENTIQFLRIKEENIESEASYTEMYSKSCTYWLRKGKYQVYLVGEERIPLFETFQPEDKIQNSEAMFFVQLYKDNPDFKRNRRTLIEIEKGYQQKVTYLENKKQNVSPLFYALCTKYFLISYLNDLLYLYTTEENEEIKQILLNHKTCTQFDDLLFSLEYMKFLKNYNEFVKTKADNDKYLRIKNNFSGNCRDYLLFDLVKESNNKELLNDFFNDCQNEAYKNYKMIEIQAKEKIISTFIRSDFSEISFEDILSKYKGRIIYVDFWASWCGPCRKLMPKSHQLEERFEKDVAFVYFSIDKSVSNWKTAARTERIDENNSFLISEESNFIKGLELINNRGIPYYMIFNRKGELIDDDAMRPDDIDFVEKMNEIIKMNE
jgi:thiol-disulfide isomerase/thioredoxin